MKKVQYGLLAVFSALALTACGDDVTKVYEDGEFSSVTSLKDSECTEENEGAIIYSTEDKGMYACADGEWTAIAGKDSPLFRCETKTLKDSSGIAIYCDGDSIGVVKNGKAGAAGKVGAAGKDGVGIDGASCTVADTVDAKTKAVLGYKLICADSLMGIVWNGAAGESGSSCTVADSVNAKTKAVVGFKLMCADTLAGFVKNGVDGLPGEAGTSCAIDSATADSVWIACGEEVAAIALPGVTAGKTYSRNIQMVIPFIVSKDVDFVPTAEVTVFSLDAKWEPNGQVFISQLNADIDNVAKPVVDIPTKILCDNNVIWSSDDVVLDGLFFKGTVRASVTNPYVLVRVKSEVYMGSGAPVIFDNYAYADLRDTSMLTVSYLTDMKASRVKKLVVANGATFEEATEQADKELYKAHGMDYKGSVDSFMNKTAMDYDMFWMLNLNARFMYGVSGAPWYFMNRNEFYSRLKDSFAENGDFNTPISVNGIFNKEVLEEEMGSAGIESVMMADMLIMFDVDVVNDAYRTILHYVSRMVEEEYGLGDCAKITKDTLVFANKKGTMLSAYGYPLICATDVPYWRVADDSEVLVMLGEENVLAAAGECSAANEWQQKNMGFPIRCEKDATGKYSWTRPDSIETEIGFCDGYYEGLARYHYVAGYYFACHNHKWSKIDADQVMYGYACDSLTKQDSIYKFDGDYYVCADTVSQFTGETTYFWQEIEAYNSSAAIAVIGKTLFGECNADMHDTVRSFDGPRRSTYGDSTQLVVCNNDSSQWVSAYSMFGLCNEEKLGLHKRVVDEYGMTKVYYDICVNAGSAEDPYYYWNVSSIDIDVGYPCTSVKEGFDKETAAYTYDGGPYYCNAKTGEWVYDDWYFRYGYVGCTDYLNPATGKAFAIGESVKFGTETLVCDSDSSWYSLSADEIAMGFPCTSVDASEYAPSTDGNHYAAREYDGSYYYCNAKTGVWLDRFDEAPCTAIYSPYSKEAFSPNEGTIGYDGSIYECKSDGSWEWVDYIN